MSLPAANPHIVPLNVLQQLRYFNDPMTMGNIMREHYGDFVPLHFQGKDYLVVMTAEGARQVFSADPNGYDVFWKESFTGLLGEQSVWVLIGEKHRRERLLFAPAVHASHFRSYGKTIRDIVRSHLEKWQPGQTIKAVDTTLAISLDIIMRLAFGIEESQSMQEGYKVRNESQRFVHPLIVFFPKLQRLWFPLWRRYIRARDVMYAWEDQLIAERRARGADTGDILSILMNARDEHGQPVNNDYIHVELNSIMSAGHETTGTALAWALYELGRHPEVMAKLRTEVESLGEDPDPSQILTLPYLGAVFNETLRLHSILAECARVPMQPMEILGRNIPAGMALVVSIVGIHHDPALYPEPNRFLPERFIERNYSAYEFLPFGGGHRRCIGAGLAEYSARIALAEIAIHWEFEPAGVDRDVRLNIAMGPKHGVRLRIKSRRNPNWNK